MSLLHLQQMQRDLAKLEAELPKHPRSVDLKAVQLLRDQVEVEVLEREAKSDPATYTRDRKLHIDDLNDRIHAQIVARQLANRDN